MNRVGEGRTPEPEKVKTMTMNNGSHFQVGEYLPWKGIFYQVADVGEGVVILNAMGYSKKGARSVPAHLLQP